MYVPFVSRNGRINTQNYLDVPIRNKYIFLYIDKPNTVVYWLRALYIPYNYDICIFVVVVRGLSVSTRAEVVLRPIVYTTHWEHTPLKNLADNSLANV